MKLSRDELKEISAGVAAVEYGSLIKAFIVKVIAFLQNLINGGSTSGGGHSGGGNSGGGNGGGNGPA